MYINLDGCRSMRSNLFMRDYLRLHSTQISGVLRIVGTVCLILLVAFVSFTVSFSDRNSDDSSSTIIVITPTHSRPERFGDLTMLAQTLMHIKNIHWVVVEDSETLNPYVADYLKSTGITVSYINVLTRGLPCRGWAQRNYAFDYLRRNRFMFKDNDVVFFGDDDNAYDYKVFDEYIRKVKVMGTWAVGNSAGALVESPRVNDGKLVGWDVRFRPERKYAVDMAGFALNIDVLLNSNATFHLKCAGDVPENCLLQQVNVPLEKIEPFGWGHSNNKPVYVWHRRTADANIMNTTTNGYIAEMKSEKQKGCDKLYRIAFQSFDEIVKILADNVK